MPDLPLQLTDRLSAARMVMHQDPEGRLPGVERERIQATILRFGEERGLLAWGWQAALAVRRTVSLYYDALEQAIGTDMLREGIIGNAQEAVRYMEADDEGPGMFMELQQMLLASHVTLAADSPPRVWLPAHVFALRAALPPTPTALQPLVADLARELHNPASGWPYPYILACAGLPLFLLEAGEQVLAGHLSPESRWAWFINDAAYHSLGNLFDGVPWPLELTARAADTFHIEARHIRHGQAYTFPSINSPSEDERAATSWPDERLAPSSYGDATVCCAVVCSCVLSRGRDNPVCDVRALNAFWLWWLDDVLLEAWRRAGEPTNRA